MKYQSLIIETKKRMPEFNEIRVLVKDKLGLELSVGIGDKLEISKSEDKNSIGIKEVNDISGWVYQKSENLRSVLINNAEKLTEEAQNSLLKIIEEPPQNILIILITLNPDLLLYTIKSRCLTINLSVQGEKNTELIKEAEIFLKSNYLERSLIIDRMSKEDKSREELEDFLLELLKILSKIDIEKTEFVKKAYIGIRRGTNVKLTLDYLNINLES